MRCPRCAFQDDKVVDSRSIRDGAAIRRRRVCLKCGHRFTTHEEIIQAELKVIKRDGSREDFDREKLRAGIEKACWKRNVPVEKIDEIVTKVSTAVESKFDREVPTEELGHLVMDELRQLDKVAYVRFASVYRDFKDIDEFISEIRTMGRRKPGSRT